MIPLNYGVQLITRAEWGARAPTGVTSLSVDKVTSHWGGPGFGAAFAHSTCAAKVRAWQNYHMDSRGWTDIAYNVVACPHRYAFEGRGRNRRSAANGTTAGNSGAYAVCYLGGEGDAFTEGGKAAMKAGGDWLTRPGSARNGHRDWKSTTCPGDEIYNWTYAGQPVAGGPTPTPTPIGDDDMPIVIAADGKPAALLSGNEMVPFADLQTLGGLNGNGVPTCVVSVADYDRFYTGFGAHTEQEMRDLLGQMTMYEAASSQILGRIEADLADEEPTSPPS